MAGRESGILRQFRQAEEYLRSKGLSTEARQKTLEQNLLRGMRQTIVRMFYYQQKEILEGLNAQTMQYENPTSPLVYYVKYKNFLCRFDFTRDPELYIQAPVLKKVLYLDDEDLPHVGDKSGGATPPPAGGNAAPGN